MMKGRRWNPVPAHSLLFSKSTKGAATFNDPIRRTNRYQQYYMYISTPPSSEVENFQMKLYYPAGDRTPDLLNQRQTCYHLSQRGELLYRDVGRVYINTLLCNKSPEIVGSLHQNTLPTAMYNMWKFVGRIRIHLISSSVCSAQGRSFTENCTKAAVLPKGRSFNANSGTTLQFY